MKNSTEIREKCFCKKYLIINTKLFALEKEVANLYFASIQ